MIPPVILWQGNIEASQLQISIIDTLESNRKIDTAVENELQELWETKKVEASEAECGEFYRHSAFILLISEG